MTWPPRGPLPTVDIIVESAAGDTHDTPPGVVLIKRRNPPLGWALPGGFVDQGETVERAALRELREETGLDGELVALLGVYSDPARDPRLHTVSVTYIARASGTAVGGDDATQAIVLGGEALLALVRGEPGPDGLRLAFDHAKILDDYLEWRATGRPPAPSVSSGGST